MKGAGAQRRERPKYVIDPAPSRDPRLKESVHVPAMGSPSSSASGLWGAKRSTRLEMSGSASDFAAESAKEVYPNAALSPLANVPAARSSTVVPCGEVSEIVSWPSLSYVDTFLCGTARRRQHETPLASVNIRHERTATPHPSSPQTNGFSKNSNIEDPSERLSKAADRLSVQRRSDNETLFGCEIFTDLI